MNKLNLTQLNKQKVAEREMKAIEGGEEMAVSCFNGGPWNGSRAWNSWNDVCCCLPGDFYLKFDMVVIA